MRRIFVLAMVLAVCSMLAGAQDAKSQVDQKNPSSEKQEVVPITEEHHHHLVLENEYVRVFHVELAPHEETKFHRHDMDYVFVTLGDSVVENDRVGEKPAKLELKDGQTVFVKGRFAHKAVNLSDKPFVNLTVELKRPVQNDEVGQMTIINGHSGHTEVLRSPRSHCSEWFLVMGGVGLQLPEEKERVVVAITDLRRVNGQENVKAGDVRWVKGALDLQAVSGRQTNQRPVRAVICEFEHDNFLDIEKTEHRANQRR